MRTHKTNTNSNKLTDIHLFSKNSFKINLHVPFIILAIVNTFLPNLKHQAH